MYEGLFHLLLMLPFLLEQVTKEEQLVFKHGVWEGQKQLKSTFLVKSPSWIASKKSVYCVS